MYDSTVQRMCNIPSLLLWSNFIDFFFENLSTHLYSSTPKGQRMTYEGRRSTMNMYISIHQLYAVIMYCSNICAIIGHSLGHSNIFGRFSQVKGSPRSLRVALKPLLRRAATRGPMPCKRNVPIGQRCLSKPWTRFMRKGSIQPHVTYVDTGFIEDDLVVWCRL